MIDCRLTDNMNGPHIQQVVQAFLSGGKTKLNIGSGDTDLGPEWCNIDGLPLPKVHVVADVQDLWMFQDEQFEEIESNHCIEHISYKNSLATLQEWTRVLKIGGIMTVRCPDVGALCLLYARGEWCIGPDGTERNIINALYGNFEDGGLLGTHRAGFDKGLLTHFFQQCGMVNVRATESDRGHAFEMKIVGTRSNL